MNTRVLLTRAAGVTVLLGIGLVGAGGLPAQKADDPAKRDGRAGDREAIQKASADFARAFEKGDARAVAAFWTEEGEYHDEGREPVRGRAALAKAYAEFFAKRPELKVESKSDSIRFVGKDSAIEEGTFTVRAKGSPANASRYSALYVRQDGRWLMALLKEWGDETTAHTSLEDLAWLIGTWEGEGGEARARTTYEWAENKKFIRSHYTIEVKEKDKKSSSSGTQVIGIDPAVGLIRAWTFDSEGGLGEAFWTHDGNRWVIDSHGTLADGSETTALNFLSRSGDDAFTWRSVKRTRDGESLPDLSAVKVRRVQAK